jgi:glycosyltransferase involved in cell wall biosynthesis
MNTPLVSVICLCYNQEKFITETLQSVVNQTYASVELIVVDDAGGDGSAKKIEDFLQNHPAVTFLRLSENKGMCGAFNLALQQAAGKYVIDLAGDDVLLPDRIARQVEVFETLDESYGAIFSDAILTDENGKKQGTFYPRHASGKLLNPVPQGNIYTQLLHSHFICTPTLMIRRSVFDFLDGYDENLVFEDLDFFIRAGRKFKFFFQDEPLTLRRLVKNSDSSKWYNPPPNPHLRDVLKICEKALLLNRTEAENEALAFRAKYHLRQCVYTGNFGLAEDYFVFLKKMQKINLQTKFFLLLSRLRLPLRGLYKLYLKLNE